MVLLADSLVLLPIGTRCNRQHLSLSYLKVRPCTTTTGAHLGLVTVQQYTIILYATTTTTHNTYSDSMMQDTQYLAS